ncbi:MAG TPA: S41 family peptidase [Pirellulales bacterium]|nr:S41 family peptidase [Pirellulales bacterium]
MLSSRKRSCLGPGFEYLRGQGDWGPKFTWRPRSTVFTFFRGKTYSGRVVVLTDERCFSVTDCVMACLHDLYPDVRFVGRPTHGGSGGPTRLAQLKHSKAELWLCIMRIWGPNGVLIEGQGTHPDVTVQWTRRDILEHTDPDFEAALKEANQAAEPSAGKWQLLGWVAVIPALFVCLAMLIAKVNRNKDTSRGPN